MIPINGHPFSHIVLCKQSSLSLEHTILIAEKKAINIIKF